MMKSNFNLLIFLISLIFSFTGISQIQIQNSEQNVVGRIYNADTKSINFSGGETSFEVKICHDSIDYETRITKKKAAKKFWALFLKGGITNTKKFIDLDDFNFSENNGLLFGINGRISFKDVYLLDHQKPFQYETFIFSIQYSYDKFDLFDTNSQTIGQQTPDKLEISGGWNHYFFLYNLDEHSRGTTIILSLNGAYNPIAYNSNSLLNFSEIDENAFVNNSVIVAKEFDGKYGILDNNVQTAELALSTPFLFDYEPPWGLPYVVPVPYISSEFFSYDKPKWNYGVALSFSSGKVFEKKVTSTNSKIDGTRKFNNPSSLVLGVDWSTQGDMGSKPNFFITGSISFK